MNAMTTKLVVEGLCHHYPDEYTGESVHALEDINLELYEGELNVDFQSCEMISDDLYLKIQERYPNRNVWIEVSEDGENGALTTYSKDV